MPNVRLIWLRTLGLLTALLLAACGDPTNAPAQPTASPPTVASTVPATSSTALTTTAAASTAQLPPTTAAPITTQPISAIVTTTTAPITPTAPAVNGAFKLKTVTDLPLPIGPTTNAILAPSGQQISFVKDSRTICIYSAQGQEQICTTTKGSVDSNSVRWSPDNRYLTYTENFPQLFDDPDIWVMDVTSGKLIDLTDDKVEGYLSLSKPVNAQIDLGPNWSSDSKRVIFVRYGTFQTETKPELYSVTIDGGAVTLLGALNSGPQRFATSSLILSPDGQLLAYSVDNADRKASTNGLWLSNATGQNSRQLYQVIHQLPNQSEPGYVLDQTFSPDGRYLVALRDAASGGFDNNWDESNSRVIGLADGRDTAVDADHPAQWATWQPGGTALAYIVRDRITTLTNNVQQAGLYLVDKPGGHGYRLVPGEFALPQRNPGWRALTWGANNTLLVMRAKGLSYVLIQFEPS